MLIMWKLPFWWLFFLLFFFGSCWKSWVNTVTQKQKTRTKLPLKCMAFTCVLFFFPVLIYISLFLFVQSLFISIVLFYNLHQSPCKKWYYINRVSSVYYAPSFPILNLRHDGSLWTSFHYRYCCHAYNFAELLTVSGMTLALIKTCPIVSILSFLSSKVDAGISSEAASVETQSYPLCHYITS